MADVNRKTFANQLFMLAKTAQIHDPENQAFRAPLDQFERLLTEMVREEGPLRFESVETSLYINEAKIRSDISMFGTSRYFEEEFERKNVGGICFTSAPSRMELIDFVRIFARPLEVPVTGAEEFNRILLSKEVRSIEFLERVERKTVSKSETAAVSKTRAGLKNYVKAVDVVRDCGNRIQARRGFESRKAKRVVYNLVDLCIDEGFSFMGLSNIKNYDEYTFNHSVNVCIISIEFGKNLGLSKKQLGELGVAALFHDYGKLAIPREILNKPGRFEPEEWELMKSHPIQAVKTLLSVQGFEGSDIKRMIAAFEHHRNYDCTGYPQTGVRKPLNFYSKIVAIADAYDAMTTNRVYQRALLPTAALKVLMDGAGTKFDPLLVKAFVNTVGIYPVGTLLKLSSGEMAIVTSANTDPAKLVLPKVKVIAGATGVFTDEGAEIDLAAQPPGEPERRIEKILRPEDYRVNVAHYLFGDAAETGKAASMQ
jgi:HD-GYP domain-containing protein (c-di-GMP phosphodiesterase class II)